MAQRFHPLRWLPSIVLVGFVLLEASCGGGTNPPRSPTATPTTITYHVSGAKILDRNGHTFIPYGVQLIGLYNLHWRYNQAYPYLTFEQMVAARQTWHSNTVSIQLTSANLFAVTPYDSAYLAKVDQEVAWAHLEGMNTLLILQYEPTTNQPLPTADSVKFWDFMSRHFRNQPWVFFDVFNEPKQPPDISKGQVWNVWQSGTGDYVGMQQLVTTIRQNAANNLIFVDGLASGEDLRGVPTHLLQGSNIVYAVHPYFGQHHLTREEWDSWFGDVAKSLPVVADEWGEFQSTKPECIPQAPTLVPQFLSYLQARHIGLIVWALYPGLLIRGWNNEDPTAFDDPVYTCAGTFTNLDLHAQGIGHLIMQYFVINATG